MRSPTRRMVSKWFLREPTRCRLCLRGYGSFLFSIAAWFVAVKPGCWELQRNPDVPPTLLPCPFPHGTPPTTGPEKSHQFCPPLWTQHKCIIFTILGLPGYVSPILVKQVSGSLGDRFANLNAYARAYAEPTRGYAISSSHFGVLGSPKVLRFFSRRSIPDLHKTNHSCAPNCLEIFLNKPIIGTKQANHN